VSGASPFAGCTSGGDPVGTNYVNSEVEPYVAVNPADPKNIIVVFQQDPWSTRGSHGLVAGVSSDAGATPPQRGGLHDRSTAAIRPAQSARVTQGRSVPGPRGERMPAVSRPPSSLLLEAKRRA
jgi:hypothetical protein